MSSSRSDVVTHFIRNQGDFLILKSSNGVSRKLEGCLKFQGCFKEVLRVYTESFKGALRKFQRCFKNVCRVFQGRLKGV